MKITNIAARRLISFKLKKRRYCCLTEQKSKKHRFGDAFFILVGEVAGFYKLVVNSNFTEGCNSKERSG